MVGPKLHLLYFKSILDICFIRFFNDFNESFLKINNQYVFSSDPGKTKLKKIFKTYIIDEIRSFIKPYSILNPSYFLIIGACEPKNNILLTSKTEYFPDKLYKLIDNKYSLKYILKEKDIKIDLVRFNSIFIDIFNELFLDQHKLLKIFGKDYKNIIFIQHKYLDCYSMFKIIKYIFGKSNCINVYKEKYIDIKSPIIAINELIDKYTYKQKICKSVEFKLYIEEIKQYLNEKMLGVIDDK